MESIEIARYEKEKIAKSHDILRKEAKDMANRIAGIVVEIGGDVGPLSRALESVNKTIRTTATQLKDVERLLKLDPTNTTLLAQKQETLKEKIGATKESISVSFTRN